MGRADIEVPNGSVDVSSRDPSACYPRSSFYPLIDGPSTQNRRVTRPWFPTCSTCRSRSQAPLCPCTLRAIADRAEGTFGRLRYPLGGDRPSQTPHQTMSSMFCMRVSNQNIQGWYLKDDSTRTGVLASKSPTYPAHVYPNCNVKL